MCRWLRCIKACLFVWLEGCQLVKTRFMLLSRREVAGFSGGCRMVFLHARRPTRLCSSCRGQNGHSVATDGQEKPRGHLRSHRQCSLHTVCACVCVCGAAVCVCVCVCAAPTPLSCNKCHPCLLGLPSKWSDHSHTNTHIHNPKPHTWIKEHCVQTG